MGGRTENTVWINLAQVTSERALVAVSVRVATGLCIHTGVFTQVTHRAEEYEQQCSAKGLHFIYQHFPHFCVFPVIILKFNRIFLFYKEKHPACYKSGESGTWARRVVPRKRRGAVLYGPGGVEGSGAGPGRPIPVQHTEDASGGAVQADPPARARFPFFPLLERHADADEVRPGNPMAFS